MLSHALFYSLYVGTPYIYHTIHRGTQSVHGHGPDGPAPGPDLMQYTESAGAMTDHTSTLHSIARYVAFGIGPPASACSEYYNCGRSALAGCGYRWHSSSQEVARKPRTSLLIGAEACRELAVSRPMVLRCVPHGAALHDRGRPPHIVDGLPHVNEASVPFPQSALCSDCEAWRHVVEICSIDSALEHISTHVSVSICCSQALVDVPRWPCALPLEPHA